MSYREYINYIEIAITKNKKFKDELTSASLAFFDKLPTYYKKEDRELKVFRNTENTKLYMLEKQKNRINIFLDNIESFQSDNSTDDLMKYPKMSVDSNKPIYSYKLLSVPAKIEEIDNKNLFDELEKLGDAVKKEIEAFKKMFKKELSEDPYFLANMKEQSFTSTSGLSDLKNLIEVFHKNNCIENKYSDEFLKTLAKELLPEVKMGLSDFIESIELLKKSSIENGFNSEQSAFEFNDLDNHVWLKDDKLIITDQNCGFYVDMINKDNFDIYFLEKEYKDTMEEIARVENCIKSNKINQIDSTILSVKDGEVVFADNQLLYVLELDVHFSVEAMQEAKIINKKGKKKSI